MLQWVSVVTLMSPAVLLMDTRIHCFPLWTSLEICAHQNRAKILHLQNHLIDWKCLPLRNSEHTILCHVPHRIVENTPGLFPVQTISESEPPLWKLMPEETRQSLWLFLVSNCYMILHSRFSREVPGFTAKWIYLHLKNALNRCK